MTKPVRVFEAVAEHDIPGIIAHYRHRSDARAQRIVSEYDRLIDLLAFRPNTHAPRSNGWRVYAFQAGPYLLYYQEFEHFWLVAGVFHVLRDPNWLRAERIPMASAAAAC